MNDFFICDTKPLEFYLSNLILAENLEDSSMYTDDYNHKWEYIIYWSEMLNIDIYVLEKVDFITVDYLIGLITKSNDKLTCVAASLSIYYKNFGNELKYRLKFIECIEKMVDQSTHDEEIIKLCIYESSIIDSTNKLEIINKPYEEIISNAKVFKEISARAKEVLKKLHL